MNRAQLERARSQNEGRAYRLRPSKALAGPLAASRMASPTIAGPMALFTLYVRRWADTDPTVVAYGTPAIDVLRT